MLIRDGAPLAQLSSKKTPNSFNLWAYLWSRVYELIYHGLANQSKVRNTMTSFQ